MIPLHVLNQTYDKFVRRRLAHPVPVLCAEHVAPALAERTAEAVRPFLFGFAFRFEAEALEVCDRFCGPLA